MPNSDAYDLFCFLALENKKRSDAPMLGEIECGCQQFFSQEEMAAKRESDKQKDYSAVPI